MRRFAGLRLSGPLPDETTIELPLLEEQDWVGGCSRRSTVESRGLRLREGTIVDASIIEAPASTKNRAGERDYAPGEEGEGVALRYESAHWCNADTGVVHSMSTTAARH